MSAWFRQTSLSSQRTQESHLFSNTATTSQDTELVDVGPFGTLIFLLRCSNIVRVPNVSQACGHRKITEDTIRWLLSSKLNRTSEQLQLRPGRLEIRGDVGLRTNPEDAAWRDTGSGRSWIDRLRGYWLRLGVIALRGAELIAHRCCPALGR